MSQRDLSGFKMPKKPLPIPRLTLAQYLNDYCKRLHYGDEISHSTGWSLGVIKRAFRELELTCSRAIETVIPAATIQRAIHDVNEAFSRYKVSQREKTWRSDDADQDADNSYTKQAWIDFKFRISKFVIYWDLVMHFFDSSIYEYKGRLEYYIRLKFLDDFVPNPAIDIETYDAIIQSTYDELQKFIRFYIDPYEARRVAYYGSKSIPPGTKFVDFPKLSIKEYALTGRQRLIHVRTCEDARFNLAMMRYAFNDCAMACIAAANAASEHPKLPALRKGELWHLAWTKHSEHSCPITMIYSDEELYTAMSPTDYRAFAELHKRMESLGTQMKCIMRMLLPKVTVHDYVWNYNKSKGRVQSPPKEDWITRTAIVPSYQVGDDKHPGAPPSLNPADPDSIMLFEDYVLRMCYYVLSFFLEKHVYKNERATQAFREKPRATLESTQVSSRVDLPMYPVTAEPRNPRPLPSERDWEMFRNDLASNQRAVEAIRSTQPVEAIPRARRVTFVPEQTSAYARLFNEFGRDTNRWDRSVAEEMQAERIEQLAAYYDWVETKERQERERGRQYISAR